MIYYNKYIVTINFLDKQISIINFIHYIYMISNITRI